MIQRIQSLWLLLAAVCAFLALKFSFYTGDIWEGKALLSRNLTGIGITGNTADIKTETNFISLLLIAATGILSLVSIFMYKTRKTQIRYVLISLVLSIISLGYMFLQTKDFADGTLSLTSIFVIVPPIFLFLAWRGIYKDEKLVRSMDRLR